MDECAGWAPQSFTSSRKNRAEVKQQSILNFLDEDEKAVCLNNIVSILVCMNHYGHVYMFNYSPIIFTSKTE